MKANEKVIFRNFYMAKTNPHFANSNNLNKGLRHEVSTITC